ncbi:MAG: UDP-2,3-diacylglucosamine diphosphatase [Bacteroidales bacterium]|nr:UDP-2,3-diacylglucosamine diphosphatase [Bacteroidales bacterium]
MTSKKRRVEVVVISDVHLGTHGCHAKELLQYLKSIKPGKLILNGDIVDIWQFKKRYWPKSHMKVVKYIIGLAAKGTKTYYITGNHDEMLRKFADLKFGALQIVNKLELELDGKKAWIFHGDVFDVVMEYSKWLAKLGSVGYDFLIQVNTLINRISNMLGKGKVSLSKKIKNNVKSAVRYINNFEETAAQMAISKGYDYIICGHIHHPEIRKIALKQGEIMYLNSGDWIENLSALEYQDKKWSICYYADEHKFNGSEQITENTLQALTDLDNKEIFKILVEEFKN